MRQISNNIQPEKKNKIKKTQRKNMMDTLYTGTRSRWRKTRPNEKTNKNKVEYTKVIKQKTKKRNQLKIRYRLALAQRIERNKNSRAL
jgi:hypothetical protein